MYLPKPYEMFSKNHPGLIKQYEDLGKACREAGPLDAKSQELVKLGLAIGTNSRGGVMSAARKAMAAGATPEEITHGVILAMTTTGFPNMIAALGWVNEVMNKQK